MQAQCNSEAQCARVSVYCLEKYLTADEVRNGLKIKNNKSADERLNEAFNLAVKMAEIRRELGVQLCMAFKQTNRETFFAEVKKKGFSEDFVMSIMDEIFSDILQGVLNAKKEK